MLSVELFRMAKICPSTEEWIKIMGYSNTRILYSVNSKWSPANVNNIGEFY